MLIRLLYFIQFLHTGDNSSVEIDSLFSFQVFPSIIPYTSAQPNSLVYSQDFHAQLYSLVYQVASAFAHSSPLYAPTSLPLAPTVSPPAPYPPLYPESNPVQQLSGFLPGLPLVVVPLQISEWVRSVDRRKSLHFMQMFLPMVSHL